MQDLNSTEDILWILGLHPRALSSGEAELYGTVDGSARGIFTKHMYEEMGQTINIDVETASTAAIGMCSRTGVGKTRHIQVRWLWIQDAIRDKVVRLRKVKCTENEADMGTKDLDGLAHQPMLLKLPLKPTQSRRLLGLIATANGGSVVEARIDGDNEEFWTFSAQTMIAILVAFLTCVMWNALRHVRLFKTAAPARTVERGTQSEVNPVDSIVIPTSVYCSPGRMPLGGDVRVCIAYSETDDEMENIVNDALERRSRLHLARSIFLDHSCNNAEQCCGCLGGRPQTVAREPLWDAMMRSGDC